MERMSWNDDDRLRTVMGVAFAVLAPVVVALLLVPIRSDVGNANLALVLVLVVVAAAILGGRRAGAVAAVMATLSFDFFLTKPFLSMEVESSDDVETVLILLGVGLLVGAVASRGRRAERAREQAADAIGHVHTVADLVAQDTPLADVATAVTRELRALLSLHDCFLELPPFLYVMPRLERGGNVDASEHRWFAGGLALSADGVELPVLERGVQVARFVLIGDPDVAVTIEERVAAVALADQLGTALALADPATRTRFEQGRRQA
jgi:hypothetical protein